MNAKLPSPPSAPAAPSSATPASVTVTVSFAPPSAAPATQTVSVPLTPEAPPPPAPTTASPPSAITAADPEPTAEPTTPPADAKAGAPAASTPVVADAPGVKDTNKPVPAAPNATPPRPPAASAKPQTLLQRSKRWLIPAIAVACIALIALVAWQMLRPKGPGEGFVSSNGRIEATEIDVSTKFSGRVQDILVADGDFVAAGQTLAHMQVDTLEAQRDEAAAKHQQSVTAVVSAQAQVAQRESDRQAVLALVAQRESELDAAQRRLARSETLTREGASSGQELDDDRARVRSVQAAVVAAKAQVAAAQAAINAA